jgi:tetratricopeptide (TPR) repeat protein
LEEGRGSGHFASILLLCSTSLASDEEVIHDCDYWRLGKDDTEKARLLSACERIIKDKRFSRADRAMAYAERASYASGQNRSDDAIADFDKALELEPDNIDWRSERAYLLYFKGDYERAIKDFDEVFAAKPDAHLAAFRGKSYLAKGDETRGFADLSKSIELEPGKSIYRYWRAQEYGKRGQIDAALTDADMAVAVQSDDRDSHLLRAELHTKKGDNEKAIADLTRAAELDPKYTVPIFNRALLYEQTKQYDRAFADYDKLLSLSPGDAYYSGRKAALMEKLARERSVLQGAWNLIKRIYDDFTFDSTAPLVVPSSPKPVATPVEAPSVQAPAPAPEAKKAEPPPEKAAAPVPLPKLVSKPAIAGKGECRRYDALSNMTIAVACPD